MNESFIKTEDLLAVSVGRFSKESHLTSRQKNLVKRYQFDFNKKIFWCYFKVFNLHVIEW